MSKHLVRSALGALATLATLSTVIGCGIGPVSTATEPESGTLVVQGNVHGGQQAVTGSTIQLWSVGSTGYGSAASKLLGSHIVTTDANGNFSISGDYTCPATGNGLVYITATGGNPGLTAGTNNSAIVLASALGSCATLLANAATTTVWIDEVTTAATAIALAQYFTPTFGSASTDSFGAPTNTQAQVGITNAFATVNNLVNTTTGNAVTSSTFTNAGFTITTTPESAKLYTIADVLAACVNSDGTSTSPCQTTLFPDVTPTGGTQPTDTLQAAVDMVLNPSSNNASGSTANIAALCGIVSATPPYSSTCGTPPADWTVGILYSDTTAGTPVLAEPLALAADAAGDIWVVNDGSSVNGGLGELSPSGSPLVGTNFPTTPGPITVLNPRNLAIDTNNNVWVPTSSTNGILFEYAPSTAAVTSLTLGKAPYGIAIDGNNNVFVNKESASSTIEIQEFLGGNLSTAYEVNYPLIGQSTVNTVAVNPFLGSYAAIDTSGNFWFSQGSNSSSATSVYALTNINTSSCGATPFSAACNNTSSASANTYTAITTGTEPYALAANASSIWAVNTVSDSVSDLPLTLAAGTNYGSSTSLNSPHYPAVDGAGNVWVSNKSAGAVAEFTSAGAILTPGYGYTHNGIAGGLGLTIDPSGNVWVANSTTGSASVFEIVGVAAPTVTPLALALHEGKVAAKP